jgi:hypothetical protein
VDELPAELAGTLCDESDELALSIPRQAEVPSRGVTHLHLREGSGSYTVSILASVAGELVAVPNSQESPALELSKAAPDAYFIPYYLDYDDDRMTLALAGTPGKVALEIDRPLLEPTLTCEPRYESLPVETPPLTLPADVELELCSARDSRVWAVIADAGRPLLATLENPASIASFTLGAYRDGTATLEPLMVAEGVAEARLGLAGKWQLSFTPSEAGVVAFYAGGGSSLREPSRLHIEQP